MAKKSSLRQGKGKPKTKPALAGVGATLSPQESARVEVRGPVEEERMAEICALLGDADHAIPILKRLLQI